MRVIDNALAGCIEVTNQVDIEVFTARGLKPGLSQDDNFLLLGFLILD